MPCSSDGLAELSNDRSAKLIINLIVNHPESCGCASTSQGFRLSELVYRLKNPKFSGSVGVVCLKNQFEKYGRVFDLLDSRGRIKYFIVDETLVKGEKTMMFTWNDLNLKVSRSVVKIGSTKWVTVLEPGNALVQSGTKLHRLTKSSSSNRDQEVLSELQKMDFAGLSEYAQYEAGAPRAVTFKDKNCINCHEQEATKHSATRHAVALQSLSNNSKADKTCLPCHSTEVSDPKFNVNEFPSNSITCSSCHGDMSRHSLTGSVEKRSKVLRDKCISCHTTETDPGFNFDQKLRKVIH